MNFNNQYRPGSFGGLPVVTKNIIIINVIVFIMTLLGRSRGVDLDAYLGLHYYLAPDFKPHQFITYIFMHADFQHIFFNMIGIFVFGQALEQVWGPKRYLIFYIVTGLGAAAGQYIIMHFQAQEIIAYFNDRINAPDTSPSEIAELIDGKFTYLNRLVVVGASGSLFGLLGAFGLLFPNREIYIYFFPIKAKWLVIGYGAIELFSGLRNDRMDNVAHFAHLGGLFVGLILVLIWRRDRRNFY
ncbi:rhomboid family intramembrane serine protease [Sphingobacteriaceae bacterium]|nr:rhomboid family intramembrane serine protease [Sphingobacteriaceae bacterium]